jgi:uncharacterized membrane protein
MMNIIFNSYADIREQKIMGYFTILASIPGFFLSSLIFLLLWSVIAPNFGTAKIDYLMAMLITITLWLAVAPLTEATGRKKKW